MIRVAHVKEFTKGGKPVLPEHVVYVGRRNNRRGLPQSPLANPWRVGDRWYGRDRFQLTPDGRTVEIPDRKLTHADCVELCRESMKVAALRQEAEPLAEVARLRALHEKHGELVLLCHCYPKPCHASVIAEALEGKR